MNQQEKIYADTIMRYFQQHRSVEWQYVYIEEDLQIPIHAADRIFNRLLQDGLLVARGAFTDITLKGDQYTTYNAFLIQEEKRKAEERAVVTNITGNTGNVFHNSPLSAERDIEINQSVTATPNAKHNKNSKMSVLVNAFFKNIFWPLIVGLILIAITILLKSKYNLSF